MTPDRIRGAAMLLKQELCAKASDILPELLSTLEEKSDRRVQLSHTYATLDRLQAVPSIAGINRGVDIFSWTKEIRGRIQRRKSGTPLYQSVSANVDAMELNLRERLNHLISVVEQAEASHMKDHFPKVKRSLGFCEGALWALGRNAEFFDDAPFMLGFVEGLLWIHGTSLTVLRRMSPP